MEINIGSGALNNNSESTSLPQKVNLLGHDLRALKEYFVTIDEKPFRAVQVLKWIHQYFVTDFSLMSNLSKELRTKLEANCTVFAPTISSEKISSDGTVKWLMLISGNNFIETVFIPTKKRGTLCISSQVGCMLTCSFCATAKQGFNRNLLAHEIIGQLWRANVRLKELGILPKFEQIPPLSNVVMMGMGEPLLNFDNVKDALAIMRDDNAYGLAKRRVTVSTSGIVPGIDRLANESEVALAISLHAPNDELRSSIMAINKKYPIKDLIAACRRFLEKDKNSKSKITVEYVMLQGINDSIKHAKELRDLLQGLPSKINLIPFNDFHGSDYSCTNRQNIVDFSNVLINAGYIATIRRTRGDDIDAACGQLAGKIKDLTKRNQRFKQKLEELAANQ